MALLFRFNFITTQGFNEHEGFIGTQVLLSFPGLIEVGKALWDILGPYILLQKHTSEITSEDINLSKFILYEYCGPLEELNIHHFENFTEMCSDSFFWYGVHRFLDLHTQHATGNNFYYRMKYSVSLIQSEVKHICKLYLFRVRRVLGPGPLTSPILPG